MFPVILPIAVGALLGAGLGYFGQCSSGTCPLTSTWWRGALYGAGLGALFGLGSGRSAGLVGSSGSADSTNLVHLASADFEAQVIHADRPVLVDFYAPWCEPCQVLAPTIAKLADAFAGRAKIVKINLDQAPELAERYHVEGIPTLLFFKGGQVVDKVEGLASAKELSQKLEKLNATAARAPEPKPHS